MSEAIAVSILIAVAVVLLLGGIFVLAIGATAWAKAISAAVNTRLHGKQVDAFGRVVKDQGDEEDDERPKLPTRTTITDDYDEYDLEDAVRSNGKPRDDEVTTTDGNSGYEADEPPVPGTTAVRGR